ncbi:sulfurtransferase TusA family protein [Laspinema sp. D1]|uniref:sulfurtransferase TusA family protein n=1 Tax=Laspinema palackyanum TaxID=3231601 RepID=UPI00348EDE89|nr:sulfurtransferase TusA family protein [Laspinema sp. D2b]
MTQNLTSEPDYPTLDLRGTPCPMNFVRTKLRLDKMNPGEVLEVWLDPGEPIEQVPDSLVMDGHIMERIEDRGGFFALQVRRADKSA